MKNRKGFTLIELLAVVTIMGILMVVAIGSVNRIIENTRRDTFASTAKEYINAVRTAVTADNIVCGDVIASGTKDGTYYFLIDTQAGTEKDLMESGGKSPFGNIDLKGYVKWVKSTVTTNPDNPQTKVTYSIRLQDIKGHGFASELSESQLRRPNIQTNITTAPVTTVSGATQCKMY